jgi:hypothetical protein
MPYLATGLRNVNAQPQTKLGLRLEPLSSGGMLPELKEAEYENLITNTIRLEPQRLTESSKSESVPSTVEIPGRDVR